MVRPGLEAGIKTSEASDWPPTILREPALRALLHVVDADRTFARRRYVAILRWTPADPDTNVVDLDALIARRRRPAATNRVAGLRTQGR